MADNRRIPCARAQYGFEGQSEHELSFSPGVSIMLLRRIDENWLEGQLDGKVGIFPASHVKIELSNPTLSHENALASSGRPYAIALYSFKGDQPGDLPFNKGELVELVGTVGSGWLRGGMNGRTGIFPASFVEILKSTDALLSTETVEVQVNGIDVDAYGEQFEESGPTPKPRPRRTSAPPTSSLIPNGSIPTSFGSHSDIKEEILIPSRSPPAPPTSSSPEYEVVDHEPKVGQRLSYKNWDGIQGSSLVSFPSCFLREQYQGMCVYVFDCR